MSKPISPFDLEKAKIDPLFISAWEITDISICDKILSAFVKDIEADAKALIRNDKDHWIYEKTKTTLFSEEVVSLERQTKKDYCDFLTTCYRDYIQEWPFLRSLEHVIKMSSFNITNYCGEQHLKGINMCRDLTNLNHFFVYATFLNDCEGKTSIQFRHYDLEIQSQKGLTLIWPADWIHAHTLNTANAEESYILTGCLEISI